MHVGLHVEDRALHADHELHDLGIVGLGQGQRVHLGVIGEIAVILQQIEGELLTLQRTLAKLTQEWLTVALLPYQIGRLAHALREWGKIVEPNTACRIIWFVDCRHHIAQRYASLRWY